MTSKSGVELCKVGFTSHRSATYLTADVLDRVKKPDGFCSCLQHQKTPAATDNITTAFGSPQFHDGCSFSERVRCLGRSKSRSLSRPESRHHEQFRGGRMKRIILVRVSGFDDDRAPFRWRPESDHWLLRAHALSPRRLFGNTIEEPHGLE
jgi:hypothetical protein